MQVADTPKNPCVEMMQGFPNSPERRDEKKTDEKYSDVITWLRTKTSIMILKSAIMCVRGSRVPFRKTDPVTDDFQLANLVAKNTER